MKFGIVAAVVFVSADRAFCAEPAPLSEVAANVEPVDPLSPADDDIEFELPDDGVGYYPTIDETMLLGGDYPRRGDSGNGPPDVRMQTEQGLYPYPNPGQGYRAPWGESLSPLNPYLGFFAPREALIHDNGSSNPLRFGYYADASFPLLVRDFSPERAMLKAGSTYFDLLYVGMTVLHSDYQGSQQFAKGSEDGWLIGIDFGLRGMVQFTDQFYLSLALTLIYLPLENDIGIGVGSGGAPSAVASIDYQFEYGTWDVRLYDNLLVGLGSDVFVGLSEEAFQQAGRYTFGFGDDRGSSDPFNGDSTFIANVIGFDAATPAWDDWRFWLSGRHTDSWQTWGFDDHRGQNSLSAILNYNGSALRFAPSAEYYLDHDQDSDNVDHRFYLGFKGRITENISLEGRAGYLWATGDSSYSDSYLYSLAFFHEITRNTSHSLAGGRDYFNNDLTNETLIASYISYTISHTFTRSLTGMAMVQYSEDEGEDFTGERTNAAVGLNYAFFNGYNSAISIRGAYEHLNGSNTPQDSDRWIGTVNYSQQLFTRITGNVFYQYEESSGAEDFNEQLIGCSVRKYF